MEVVPSSAHSRSQRLWSPKFQPVLENCTEYAALTLKGNVDILQGTIAHPSTSRRKIPGEEATAVEKPTAPTEENPMLAGTASLLELRLGSGKPGEEYDPFAGSLCNVTLLFEGAIAVWFLVHTHFCTPKA